MASRAKGDQEILYFGPGLPCGGLDYSLPYNCLPPNSLAPGTINTSQIDGFVTSSPWLANPPYITGFAATEFVLGFFTLSTNFSFANPGGAQVARTTIIVTNVQVYVGIGPNVVNPVSPTPTGLTSVHTWAAGEITTTLTLPGNAVSFVEVNGTVYFTGIMLNGIFSLTWALGTGFTFAQATNYVCGYYISELAGRLFVAQCRFPGGGGTGTGALPTVAWSGPGQYAGSGASDPWNPVNNFGGGFNLLSDVPDQISGVASMGRSAIIFRLQGLSQMDPNGGPNAGVQPFNFYHLWASAQGVGAYPGTVAQFGYTAYFRSSDNIYSINLSAGPQPIGPKIIAKINADARSVANSLGWIGNGIGAWYWNFGSIVTIAGEQHYLLTLSATMLSTDGNYTPLFTSLVYDYNIFENCWHQWDMSQYVQASGATSPVIGFSCPIFQCNEQFEVFALGAGTFASISGDFVLVGYFSSYGTTSSYQPQGNIAQFVFWDYDWASQWITFKSALYAPLSMPVPNIILRGEILSLGHRTVNRRIRVQADNAPMPSFASGSQQQAKAFFTGSLQGNVSSSFLAWTQSAGASQPVPYMQGNYQPQGAPMQTYYADMVLEDEMIQASIQGYTNDTANPWNSLPALRISSVSLITMDPKSTTQ